MTVSNELKRLTTDPAIHAKIDIVDGGKLPEKEARKLAFEIWQAIKPKAPAGMRHLPESYWGQATAKMVYMGLVGKRPVIRAQWLVSNRNASRRPIYVPQARLPEPTPRKF